MHITWLPGNTSPARVTVPLILGTVGTGHRHPPVHQSHLHHTQEPSMCWLLLMAVAGAAADVNTMTDKILKDILKDYNPDSRPAGKLTDR